jgi:large subunit ribosomal protein L9
MQLILTRDVEHLGKAGELVTVKSGYGRNYLVPQGYAVSATQRNRQRLEHEQKVIAARVKKTKDAASSLAARLNGMVLQFERRVSDDGKMFGSVTARNITDQLAVAKVELDHRRLVLPEPIKALGKYEVPIKLDAGMQATLKFWVVSQDRE